MVRCRRAYSSQFGTSALVWLGLAWLTHGPDVLAGPHLATRQGFADAPRTDPRPLGPSDGQGATDAGLIRARVGGDGAPLTPEVSATPRASEEPRQEQPERPNSDSDQPVVEASTETPAPAPPEPQAEPSDHGVRLDLGADLTALLGQGTFLNNENARNPFFAWLLTLRPMLFPTKNTRVFLFQNISQELTQTDSDTRNYRVLLSDTLLGGRVSFYTVPATKTTLDAGLLLALPTSLASQYETLYLAARPGLGFTQPFKDRAVLMMRSEFLKNFHAYTSPVGNIAPGASSFLARQGGSELINSSRVSPGGNNVSYEVWNRALFSYRFQEGWAATALLIVINGFTYENFPLDEASGQGARAGRGRRDQAYAEINAGYTWAQKYNLSGGIVTQGSLTPADGQGVRFPFFDFSSPAENLTSFLLRFSVTYPVLGAPKARTMPNIAQHPRPSTLDL